MSKLFTEFEFFFNCVDLYIYIKNYVRIRCLHSFSVDKLENLCFLSCSCNVLSILSSIIMSCTFKWIKRSQLPNNATQLIITVM